MAVTARDRGGPRLRAQGLIYPALRPERAPTAIVCAAELDIVFPAAANYSAALQSAGPAEFMVACGFPHTFLRALLARRPWSGHERLFRQWKGKCVRPAIALKSPNNLEVAWASAIGDGAAEPGLV